MIPVVLTISSSRAYDDRPEEADDVMEFVTEGQFYQRGARMYLIYEESQLTGLEGCRTRLTLEEDALYMIRRGSSVGVDTEMHFRKGKRFSSYYDTPYGPVEMEILTNELKNSVTKMGEGELEVDYNISLKGLGEGRNRLHIQVKNQ